MKLSLSLLALTGTLACLSLAPAAHAQDQTFTFDFIGLFGGEDVSGTLFASPNGDSTYTALSGSITVPVNSRGYTPGTYGLLPAGTLEVNPNSLPSDNILYPDGFANTLVTVDEGGLAFGNVGCTYGLQIFSGEGVGLFDTNGNFDITFPLSLEPAAATPEPGTYALLGTLALTSAGFLVRRRK